MPATQADTTTQPQISTTENLGVQIAADRPDTPCPATDEDTTGKHAPVIHGVVIGWIQNVAEDGSLRVDYDGNPFRQPLQARLVAAANGLVSGQAVALMFEQGNPRKPLFIGPIHQPDPSTEQPTRELITEKPISPEQPLHIQTDSETIALTAKKELVLRCGKASITLTRAGKILIRGAYLLNRSSGVNRIKGGSVQIN